MNITSESSIWEGPSGAVLIVTYERDMIAELMVNFQDVAGVAARSAEDAALLEEILRKLATDHQILPVPG